jgi:hypothetical protein
MPALFTTPARTTAAHPTPTSARLFASGFFYTPMRFTSGFFSTPLGSTFFLHLPVFSTPPVWLAASRLFSSESYFAFLGAVYFVEMPLRTKLEVF